MMTRKQSCAMERNGNGGNWRSQATSPAAGLLFASLAAIFSFERAICGIAGRTIKPAGKNGLVVERTRLPRQNDEHGLSDFLGQLRIPYPP